MIDFDRKLIFIHLPKTGGSSIESVFLGEPRLLDHDDPERTTLILTKYKEQFCNIHHPHATLQQHQRQLGPLFKDFKVFTVVRNPWDAIFSRFCYCFKFKKDDFLNPKNFQKFLSFYQEMNYENLIGSSGDTYVHYILNYYDLENEINRMLRSLNLSEIKLPLGNLSKASTLDYRLFYTEESKRMVKDSFRQDILRFGWTFESRKPEGLSLYDPSLPRTLCSVKRSQPLELRTATVCSHPPALAGLQFTIDSLINQVDKICVYLNDIATIPAWLEHPKIEVVLSKDSAGDLKSNGGHFFSEKLQGYCFAVDDDIIYPSDYVAMMISKIEAYNRKAIICVHGSILRYPIVSYYLSRFYFPFTSGLQEDLRVSFGSNGTLAYHTDTIRFSLKDFPETNMSDLYISLKAARNNIPIVCIERSPKWLAEVQIADKTHKIYFNRKKYEQAATELIQENITLFKNQNLFFD